MQNKLRKKIGSLYKSRLLRKKENYNETETNTEAMPQGIYAMHWVPHSPAKLNLHYANIHVVFTIYSVQTSVRPLYTEDPILTLKEIHVISILNGTFLKMYMYSPWFLFFYKQFSF